VALGVVALLRLPAARRKASAHDHFDEIETCYDAWLPEHYRAHLVGRKTGAMLGAIRDLGPNPRGLDVGCGRGWYMTVLQDAGAQLAGVDTSRAQLAAAGRYLPDATRLAQASVERLPFASGRCDFVYIINVLHHVPPPSAQRAALAELARVVRPGGLVFVHEMNVRNPLFRFYLSYLFPVLKGIEEGTEYYLRPNLLGDLPGLRLRSVDYFTFLPDFVPARALQTLAALERRLERGALGPYAAHFMTCHERVSGPTG
jgi:ubiquinone/menaquinone biosynthesis C-methylase UbiE